MFDKLTLEPLPFPGLADFHCHCDFSADAEGAVDEYCQAALQRGLVELCFTTHYDSNFAIDYGDNYIRVDGDLTKVTPEGLAPYVDAVKEAHDRFYPNGLSVKLGLEYGWNPGCEEEIVRLKEMYEFDHFLCGIHTMDNKCFCSPKKFEARFGAMTVEQYVENYFSMATSAAQSGLFNALAHLGYYLRCGVPHFGDDIRTLDKQYLPGLFEALKATNTSLEINTAPFRRGEDQYHPVMSVINAARREGIRLNFLGSDAHSPRDVGFDFEGASVLADDLIAGCLD